MDNRNDKPETVTQDVAAPSRYSNGYSSREHCRGRATPEYRKQAEGGPTEEANDIIYSSQDSSSQDATAVTKMGAVMIDNLAQVEENKGEEENVRREKESI